MMSKSPPISLWVGGLVGLAGTILANVRGRYVPVSFVLNQSRGILPRAGTKGSAGWDLAIPDDVTIGPGETKVVDLGFSVAVPNTFYVSLQTRSSMSIRSGLILANGTEGVIDSDYRDTIKLALWNRSDQTLELKRGDRVAQMLFKRFYRPFTVPSCSWVHWLLGFRTTDRRGGLGSTGR